MSFEALERMNLMNFVPLPGLGMAGEVVLNMSYCIDLQIVRCVLLDFRISVYQYISRKKEACPLSLFILIIYTNILIIN